MLGECDRVLRGKRLGDQNDNAFCVLRFYN